MTHLCIPILGKTLEQMQVNIDRAVALDAQTRSTLPDKHRQPVMLELRLDGLQPVHPNDLREFITRCRTAIPNELIATCRIASEGGAWNGDEASRLQIFRQAVAAGVHYLDIELTAWCANQETRQFVDSLGPCGQRRTRFICSQHDFNQTPTDLSGLFDSLATSSADVVKFACRANTIVDSIRVLDALRDSARQRSSIGLAMGEAGLMARILAGKAGGFLTFASLEAGQESAPGQIDLRQMRGLYRAEVIDAATEILGVIGCPVAHSMSPAIFNAAFAATNRRAVYLPFRIEPSYEAFQTFVEACREKPWLALRGCSVTIPHKENLLRYVRGQNGDIEELAARIGAANTLVMGNALQESNAAMNPANFQAFNTDQTGALRALCDACGCTLVELGLKKVAVLGAGGVARAIVAGLCDAGCPVILCNRTLQRTENLAHEFGADVVEWNRRSELGSDITINCTSIGMWPKVDDTPLPEKSFTGRPVVFDTIYNPLETRLLREARERGCRTINGTEMFINQAAQQYEIWFRAAAPLEIMRTTLLAALTATDH